jgi:uncharacterized protein (DUF362 family)
MKIHPLLKDETAVLVYRTPVPASAAGAPSAEDFRRAAQEALAVMQVELEGEAGRAPVAIKPNVTSGERFADPDLGIGTHPAFVEGLVAYRGAPGPPAPSPIYVVEDPRNSDDRSPRHWLGTGYREIAAASGVRLRSPVSYYCTRKQVPRPFAHPTYNITRYAVDPGTLLINVPKLKTHNLAITTLCLKNLMGLVDVYERHFCAQAWREIPVPPGNRGVYARPKSEWMDADLHVAWQKGLARRLVDLAQVVTPALNLVEGVVGRDGTGFQRGRNYPLGLVIAGINMVAVDTIASYLMGFDPTQLIYLQAAAAAGLGCNDPIRLRVFIASGGALIPCPDLEPWKAQPPMRVIRDILGESSVETQ